MNESDYPYKHRHSSSAERGDMGGNQAVHKFKLCNKCEKERAPEGGVEMGSKWMCATCWIRRSTVSSLKQNRR